MDGLVEVIDLTMIRDDEDYAQEVVRKRKRQRTGELSANSMPQSASAGVQTLSIKDNVADAEPSFAPEPDSMKNEDLIKDALNVVFTKDEEDKNKRCCVMCMCVLLHLTFLLRSQMIDGADRRSRYKAGLYPIKPRSFVNRSSNKLVGHCERVHPAGWEVVLDSVLQNFQDQS